MRSKLPPAIVAFHAFDDIYTLSRDALLQSVLASLQIAPRCTLTRSHATARWAEAESTVPTTSIVGDLCDIMSVRRVRGWTIPRLGAANVSTYHRGAAAEAMLLTAQSLTKVRLTRDNVV